MSWILSKEGQLYMKRVAIVEKAIIDELNIFREELTDGQIKLIANTSARKAVQDLMESEGNDRPL